MNEKKLRASAIEELRSIPWALKEKDGYFYGDIDADYRDEMEPSIAAELLESDDPELELYDKLDEWYLESRYVAEDDLEENVIRGINGDYGELTEAEKEMIRDIAQELVFWQMPANHFLDQEYDVNIMVDSGDANYDFTLNSVYPCYYGEEGDEIDPKAGIVWLAETQGYSKEQLEGALKDGDMADPHGFLESMRVELANLPNACSAVTFLVKLTLRQLMELQKALRAENPSGYLLLGKETMCGLFNPWEGGGSVLDVELEKDVKLPIQYIWEAQIDDVRAARSHHQYSVGDVYGLCGSAWKDTVKKLEVA